MISPIQTKVLKDDGKNDVFEKLFTSSHNHSIRIAFRKFQGKDYGISSHL